MERSHAIAIARRHLQSCRFCKNEDTDIVPGYQYEDGKRYQLRHCPCCNAKWHFDGEASLSDDDVEGRLRQAGAIVLKSGVIFGMNAL